MDNKVYEFKAIIKSPSDLDGGYVEVPSDIKKKFEKKRLPVYATFDGEPYQGSIVNMGIKNNDGSICYIIIVCKYIRTKIGKKVGDVISVTIKER